MILNKLYYATDSICITIECEKLVPLIKFWYPGDSMFSFWNMVLYTNNLIATRKLPSNDFPFFFSLCKVNYVSERITIYFV